MKDKVLLFGFAIIIIVAIISSLGQSDSNPSFSSSSAQSVSNYPKYTIMNKMTALGFAVTVTDYEEKVSKYSESSLTRTQRIDAASIKGLAKAHNNELIVGLLSGDIQMLAWADGENVSCFYFKEK